MPIKSLYPNIDIPNVSVHKLLFDAMENVHDNVIAVQNLEETIKYTFGEFKQSVKSLATYFVQNGLNKNDQIVLILPNVPEYGIIFLAGSIAGAVTSGINPDYTSETGQNVIALKLLINTVADSEILNKVFINPKEDLVIMPYSSGTTGKPKGVMLTHRNFVAETLILHEFCFKEMSEMERAPLLSFLPFYHGSGFWSLFYALFAGNGAVTIKKFQVNTMLQAIQKYQVKLLSLVPPIMNILAKDALIDVYSLSSLRILTIGAAPLGKELTQMVHKRFPSITNLMQCYGATECVCLSHMTPLGIPQDQYPYGSCGHLLPNFQCKVSFKKLQKSKIIQLIDIHDGQEITDPYTHGELYLKSDSIMKGYKDNAEENAVIFDKDGWMKTGDVVYFDKNNFFYVVDRMKDMIKVKGIQISPVELDNLLLCHPAIQVNKRRFQQLLKSFCVTCDELAINPSSFPYIMAGYRDLEAAVIGVYTSKEIESGELPVAFVVKKPDAKVNAQEIMDFIKMKVAPHKYLDAVYFTNSLPKSGSGKVLKRVLRMEAEKRIEQIKNELDRISENFCD